MNSKITNREGDFKLAALEEAGLLLFSRDDYLSQIMQDVEAALEAAGVPEKFWDDFKQAIKSNDFGQELVLMAKVLEKKGIKLVLTGVDRFSSGEPWEPTPALTEWAKQEPGKVLINRRYSRCVGCGGLANISVVTKGHYWKVEIDGRNYYVCPIMGDLSGLVEAINPYYAPMCGECNDLVRPGMLSTSWPIIKWT